MRIEKTFGKQASVIKESVSFNHVIKIYIPSTDREQPIDNTSFVNKSLKKFSKWFGGATAIEGTGAWISDDEELIKEKVTIVYSFAEDLNVDQLNEAVKFAKALKQEMEQSSMSLEINGAMYFID